MIVSSFAICLMSTTSISLHKWDNCSGLMKQEGHKPCQIISPQLDIGGHIHRNASNGNTDVLINGREITKRERWILKVAMLNPVKFVWIRNF